MTQPTAETQPKSRLQHLIDEKDVAYCHDHVAGATLGFNIDKDNRRVFLATSFCHKKAGKNSAHMIDEYSKATGRLKIRGRITSEIHAFEQKKEITLPFSGVLGIPEFYKDLRVVEILLLQKIHAALEAWKLILKLDESKGIDYRSIPFNSQTACLNEEFFIDLYNLISQALEKHELPKKKEEKPKKEEKKS